MYAVVIILALVLIGIYMMPKSKEAGTQTQNNAYSTSTPTVTSVPDNSNSTTTSSSIKNSMNTITIETNKGTIVFETYDADAPKAAQNFVDLANKGYYNGVIFHRVIKGFMIQGGDPTGTGRGGPGYTFADELNPNTVSAKAGYQRGVVAMANSGPNTNGSQFFIMHADYPLPHNYTIFGKVVKGLDVVDAIATTPVDGSDRPLSEVKMLKVTAVKK